MATCRRCGRIRYNGSPSQRCACVPAEFWESPQVAAAARDLDAAQVVRLLHVQAHHLNRSALAELTGLSPSSISRILAGGPIKRVGTAREVLHALGAPRPGTLASSLPSDGHGEAAERIAQLLEQPDQVDAAAVEAMASLLAVQRRLDDEVGAEAILPLARAHADTASAAAHRARGPHARALRVVAAEWRQFDGWLHASTGRLEQAEAILRHAEALAREVEEGPLLAQARNFRAYIARRRGDAPAIAAGFLAAFHTPGAHPAQRVGDAIQAAHGHALLGERQRAQELLDEAARVAEQAAALPPPPTAYWLTPTFHHLSLGLAHTGLGNTDVARDLLTSGLAGLPVEQQGADWTQEYRNALERLAS